MTADVFIPVRLDSTRLPKKHLLQINGNPVIINLINKLRSVKNIRNIVICTTDLPSDDPLINLLEQKKIEYFRGSNKDILSRFLMAAKKFDSEIIVDVEGDKLYMDINYVEKVISKIKKSKLDFVCGNDSKEVYNPSSAIHGLIPAAIRISALERICKIKKTNNTETGYKEFFIRAGIFDIEFITPQLCKTLPKNLRLTLDYEEDFLFAKKIFEQLGNEFTTKELLLFIKDHPNFLEILDPLAKKWETNYQRNLTDYSLKSIFK